MRTLSQSHIVRLALAVVLISSLTLSGQAQDARSVIRERRSSLMGDEERDPRVPLVALGGRGATIRECRSTLVEDDVREPRVTLVPPGSRGR